MGGANILRTIAAARGGNVAMMFAILLVPVLFGAGVAVDFARKAQAQAIVQEAADAALLRAARMRSQNPSLSDSELTAAARRIFDAALTAYSSVSVGAFSVAYDSQNEIFRLDVSGNMRTSVLSAVGVPALGVGTAAEVKLGKPPYLEVVLALDNTGSMNQNNKLQDLKDSASELIESLFSHPDADIKVGLVPFAQYVNVGVSNKNAPWMGASSPGWSGCVGSRLYPANIEDEGYDSNPIPAIDGNVCPTRIHPLSTQKNLMLNAINAMTGGGWTYIPSGLAWGWRALSDNAPFSEGLSQTEIQNREGVKALILLTDGENTRAPSYPAHNSTDRALADSLTLQLCEAVKDDGIVLYTIAFDVTDSMIRELMEQCGTSPSHYFEPESAAELSAAFADIAYSLRKLRLSR